DLDSVTATGGSSVQPTLGADQKTNNATLKKWVPALNDVDALIDATPEAKTITDSGDPMFAVRVAYQIPVEVTMPGANAKEIAYPYTFEDALVFENVAF
ncbi:ATP-dependent endonuclease, partial [Pandoraea pneumonica]